MAKEFLIRKINPQSCNNSADYSSTTGVAMRRNTKFMQFGFEDNGTMSMVYRIKNSVIDDSTQSAERQFTFVMRLSDLSPDIKVIKEEKISMFLVRGECTSGKCVAGNFKSDSGKDSNGNINYFQFPPCSNVEPERLARALSDVIRLSGGKRSAY